MFLSSAHISLLTLFCAILSLFPRVIYAHVL